MVQPAGRRPSLVPRGPRLLHSGPRVRILELALLLHVVLIFLAGFLAWLLLDRDREVEAGLCLLAIAVVILMDLRRLAALKRIRSLAAHGLITTGEVISSRLTRLSRAPRADGPLPRGGRPFVAYLEVTYAFEDDEEQRWTGRFVTARRDRPLYPKGRSIEVFYLDGSPAMNISSLVLRWYWRLGGATLSEDSPEAHFVPEEGVEVRWID